MLQWMKEQVQLFVKQPRFLKNLMAIYLTYLVGFLAILQANCLYKTDWTRAAGTHVELTNWRHSGRIINDALTYLFDFSSVPQDISPLTQLLSILFLSIASLILTQVICHKITYRYLLVSVIIGLSPYYLQIMSYVFDSVFYSLATLMAIIPFLFYRNHRAFYLSSGVCLLWCLMSFQATISIYMIVVTYLFYTDYQNEKIPFTSIIKKLGITVGLFLSIGLIYYMVVRLIFTSDSAALVQSDVCLWSDCGQVFGQNVKKATVDYFYKHWVHTPMGWAFLSVLICFIVFQIKQGWQNKRPASKIINILVAIVTPVCLLLFIALWTLFFTFIYWNARIWVGAGVCWAVMMLALMTESNRILKKIFWLISVALIWGCIVFSNRVGNLLDVQNKYVDFKIFVLSQDLSNIPVKNIIFKHNTVHSPVLKIKAQEYPILKDLVSGIQHKWRRFTDYYFGFYRSDLSLCEDYTIRYWQPLIDNPHHSITRINDQCLVIEMK